MSPAANAELDDIAIATAGHVPGESLMENRVALVITDTQEFDVSIETVNRRGNPAPVENASLTSSDPAVLEIVRDPAGPAGPAEVFIGRATGVIGVAQVLYRADPVIGEGEGEIIGMADVEVVPSQAVTARVTLGAPREQVLPEPA